MAFVCRVLRAPYFPCSSYLEASLDSSLSYTWTSIHASQGLVRMGTWWKVGNGRNVNVWDAPWVNDDRNFRVNMFCPQGLEVMRVSELINDFSATWDVELISALMESEDVERILRMTLPSIGVDDSLI